jgi:MFS-type transporter involved in bile tolerance (Atg22 family)
MLKYFILLVSVSFIGTFLIAALQILFGIVQVFMVCSLIVFSIGLYITLRVIFSNRQTNKSNRQTNKQLN